MVPGNCSGKGYMNEMVQKGSKTTGCCYFLFLETLMFSLKKFNNCLFYSDLANQLISFLGPFQQAGKWPLTPQVNTNLKVL